MNTLGKLCIHKPLQRWFVRHNGKQVYLGTKNCTQEEAEQALIAYKIAHNITDGDGKDNNDRPLEYFFADYVLYKKQNWSERYSYNQHTIFRAFFSAFGQKTPRQLMPADIVIWVESHETWGSTYKRCVYTSISIYFTYMMNNRGILCNPVKKIENRPQAEARSGEYIITLAEHRAIMEEIPAVYQDILQLMWESGSRPDEMCDLHGSEYDAQSHMIHKHHHKNTKKGKARDILLTDRAEEIIQERIKVSGKGLLFHSIHGRKIEPGVMLQSIKKGRYKVWDRYKICCYSWRHSFAHRMANKGTAILTIATWMGNTVAVTEKHYTHHQDNIGATRHLLTD